MLEDTLINKKERQEKLALVVQMAVAKGDTEFMFENEKYIKKGDAFVNQLTGQKGGTIQLNAIQFLECTD